MEVFSAAPHEVVLTLLVQIAVLLFAARAFGEVASRFGQPSVVGEILAGIVLGPSCLSSLVPFLGAWVVPSPGLQGHLLEVFAMLGAVFLLLITGLETDFALIRRHARTALGVSAGGILMTFSTGFLLGQMLPDSLVARPEQRLVFALFVATAMAISAIPVIAKVLIDLNLLRRDIGQTIIAAGMSDDTTGWILLSIVAGLAAGESVTPATVLGSAGSVLAFLLVSFTLGRRLVKRVLDYVQDEVTARDRLLTLVVVLTLAWGAVAQALDLEAVLGAFVAGMLFGQMPRLPEEVRGKLSSIALGIFAPVFFAVAGLKVNLLQLLRPSLMLAAFLVIAVATAGKVAGTYLGARLIGRRDHWTALSFGAALNARGAMEIIVATIGLSLGILNQEMFSIIVLMAISTSLMAPPALRWVLDRVEPEEQEIHRLRLEELAAGSRIAGIHRVLLPARSRSGAKGTIQATEAILLDLMGRKSDLSITLLTVVAPGQRADAQAYLDSIVPQFSRGEVVRKVVEGEAAADLILDETKKNYDLLVLGATEQGRGSDVLFTSIVDFLVRVAPCPTMVVKGHPGEVEKWMPKKILVPTNGTVAARHAAEMAFALAAGPDQEVIILNVVVQDRSRYGFGQRAARRQFTTAHQIVEELRELGASFGVKTSAQVRVGPEPDSVILETARAGKIDLIVLGTAVRAGSERLFLGARVERVLQGADCPVVVVNAA
jgi:Kef-type K+ transport system membrane component KefB